jgi:Fe2+ transport system protein FeoA
MVDDSKSRFANFLRRFWPSSGKEEKEKENGGEKKPAHKRKHGQEGEHLVPLSHIPEGKTVEVGDTQDMPPSRLAKLSIFGLIPGGQVELLQRRPAPILRIDQTELTLSEDILNQIWVRV